MQNSLVWGIYAMCIRVIWQEIKLYSLLRAALIIESLSQVSFKLQLNLTRLQFYGHFFKGLDKPNKYSIIHRVIQ